MNKKIIYCLELISDIMDDLILANNNGIIDMDFGKSIELDNTIEQLKQPSYSKQRKGEIMTLDEIKKNVENIKTLSNDGDDEIAHKLEDELYVAFVEHVAKSDLGNISIMAKEIIKTKYFNFSRWYC